MVRDLEQIKESEESQLITKKEKAVNAANNGHHCTLFSHYDFLASKSNWQQIFLTENETSFYCCLYLFLLTALRCLCFFSFFPISWKYLYHMHNTTLLISFCLSSFFSLCSLKVVLNIPKCWKIMQIIRKCVIVGMDNALVTIAQYSVMR